MLYLYKIVDDDQSKGFIWKLMLYPIIIVVCWIWGTINGIHDHSFERIFWLTACQTLFSGLQGFFNSMIYGFTSQVKVLIVLHK